MPICAECGEPFQPRTAHKRLYCNPECANKAAQRRYRAKPEVKAQFARRERERRKRHVDRMLAIG